LLIISQIKINQTTVFLSIGSDDKENIRMTLLCAVVLIMSVCLWAHYTFTYMTWHDALLHVPHICT